METLLSLSLSYQPFPLPCYWLLNTYLLNYYYYYYTTTNTTNTTIIIIVIIIFITTTITTIIIMTITTTLVLRQLVRSNNPAGSFLFLQKFPKNAQLTLQIGDEIHLMY